MWDQISAPADRGDVAAVVALARVATPRCGSTVVVAIDGPSGAGKTTLAAGVVDALGWPIVHMDQIFPGWDGLEAAPELLATHVLEPLSRGEHAAYREWDWAASTWGRTIDLPYTSGLVVEGCGSSVRPAGAYASVRIWLDAPRAIRMARGLARDGEVFAPHWQRWADQERVVFGRDQTREHADLVLDTDRSSPMSLSADEGSGRGHG